MRKEKTVINEICIQYKRPPIDSMAKVLGSKDVNTLFRNEVDLSKIDLKESFWIILLTRSNHVLGIQKISEGSTNGTVVSPKLIFQFALKTNAESIILVHNHPSGNIHPSSADIFLTKKIKEAGSVLEISALDHLIGESGESEQSIPVQSEQSLSGIIKYNHVHSGVTAL